MNARKKDENCKIRTWVTSSCAPCAWGSLGYNLMRPLHVYPCAPRMLAGINFCLLVFQDGSAGKT